MRYVKASDEALKHKWDHLERLRQERLAKVVDEQPLRDVVNNPHPLRLGAEADER
ncbi:hypothetical protein [Mycolicibacter engbaekii]|uniref:hypothetical protein n=1 Tax=Mycolicibacter engbaekii TaxID=188915 RepID=UPI0013FE02C8|nr:hypothetical protein [Mycolicibacter engbaekii]